MIVGLDMGGTHIDGVIIKEGQVIETVKKPTDRADLFTSIWTALEELLVGYDQADIQRINLSTTVSTNAIVEDKTSTVGMIIQSGPGLNHDFLACGDENFFISGYVDHRGKVVDALDTTEIEEAIMQLNDKKVESYGVVSKFSTRNPNHELAIEEMILEKSSAPITIGHRMSGELNFPRRVFTSYLNSAIYKTFQGFAHDIKKSLEKEGIDAPLFILKADAGTMNIKSAEEKPVETILSGPAASFLGMSSLLPTEEDAILLDMGGTTTDIFFLADGVPLFEPLGIKIDTYNTLVRAVYSVSIGLGGDSHIKVIDGELKIGPKRAGYPIAFGGPEPTPTDAMVVLGLLEEGNRDKAYGAMEALGKELDITAEATAEFVLNQVGELIQQKVNELLAKINSQPVYTVKELLDDKKIEPKEIQIIGGPAQVLAPMLEEKIQLPTRYPKNYQVANAIGAALAKTTTEITMLADTGQGTLSVPELGIYERIGRKYTLADAKARALELLEEAALAMGADQASLETEIIEESSFNMVDGFTTIGKNIRIKTQVKPGLIHKLREDNE